MRKIIRHITLFWLLAFQCLPQIEAQDTLKITNPHFQSARSLEAYTRICWMPSSSESFELISEKKFRPLQGFSFDQLLESQSEDGTIPSFLRPYRSTDFDYWLRILIQNKTTDTLHSLLKFNLFDHIELFEEQEKGLQAIAKTGLLHPENSENKRLSPLQLPGKYSFPINILEGETATFFIKIHNDQRFETSDIRIALENPIIESNRRARQLFWFLLINGCFLGMLLFVGLFSLLQFWQNQDRAHLYYASYLIGLLFFFIWKFEKSVSVIPSIFTYASDWYYHFEVPLSIFIYLAYIHFVQSFLEIKKYQPRLFRFSQIGYLFIAAYLLIHFLLLYVFQVGLKTTSVLYYYFRFFLYAPGIYYLWQIFKNRRTPTKYIMVGTLTLFAFSLITLLLSSILKEHYYGIWDIPLLPSQAGILLEIVCFSLGLAYRGKLILLQKNEAQNQLISELKKNQQLQERLTQKLESEVQKRTKEVLEQQEALEQQRRKMIHVDYNHRLAKSELKALKAQLNPHFIFNCLNSIRNLIAKGALEKSETYLLHFSSLLRKVLLYSEQQSIPLREELEICRLYLELESMRFEGQFEYVIEVDVNAEIGFSSVPPLILQPWLENAIRHGLLPKKGARLLKIEIKKEEEGLSCIIEDNGVGRGFKSLEATERGTGMGMHISQERLKFFNEWYETNLQAIIFDKKDAGGKSLGTRIVLQIPY